MKNLLLPSRDHRVAFTLIELLVVIAVIAVLAGLMFPVMGAISGARVRKVAYAEMQQIQTAIEAYKAKKGTYPPDNPASVFTNQLYFELTGTIVSRVLPNGQYVYTNLDLTFGTSSNALWTAFNTSSLANSSPSARGTDDSPAPESFLKDPKPAQYFDINFGGGPVRILVCSEGWTFPGTPAGLRSQAVWRYNYSHPTNNPSSYDLWVDLYIRGKTNRISNWSKEPQILK